MVDFLRRSAVQRSEVVTDDDDTPLDPAFYRTHYPDLADHDDEAAVLHWRRHGKRENRVPNARAALLNHPNIHRLPADFDPVDYVVLNRDLSSAYFTPLAATLHFLDYGLAEGRRHRSGEADPAFLAAYRNVLPPPTSGDLSPLLDWVPKTVGQFLYLHGFLDAVFVRHLDVDFYWFTNALGPTDAPRDRFACLFHFAARGADALAPLAEPLRFDPAFHRRCLRTAGLHNRAARPDPELYRLWLAEDDFAAFPPNHRARMRARFGVACGTGGPVDLATYRLANRDLQALDDETLLEHLFGNGLGEARSSVKIDRTNVALFTRYADHLERREDASARDLYRRLAHFVPGDPMPNQQLGDALMRDGCFAEAYRCYRAVIEGGSANKWAYLSAATCCERLGDAGTAVTLLGQACRTFPDDQGLVRRRDAAAERFFGEEIGYANALAAGGRIGDAQARVLAAAVQCDFPAQDAAPPPRAIRTVALFANMDLPQCTLYRVEQKAEQLIAAGFAVRVYAWLADQAAFERSLAECDAVIFFRVAALPGVTRAINAARAAGLATFYDIDDLIFDADEYPEPYESYAGQITRAEYGSLCVGVPLFRYALGLCDYAIASTPSLARRMEPLVRRKRAFVHPNGLGGRHERAMAAPPARSADGPVTLFYGSGTKAHKLDFETILLPALEEIDRRFGAKVDIVFAGHRPVTARSGLLSRVRFEPFTPEAEDYWALLGRADIALSVLGRTPVTDAKSEIKWLESAMFGIPSVVSATETFEAVIEQGVDGFLAASPEDFVEAVALLVRDKARRAAVGEAARSKALGRYGAAALSDNLRDMLGAVAEPARARTRVLVVNVFFPPQATGGATRVVADNIADIRALHPDAFEFEVFTTLDGGSDPYAVRVSSFDGVRTTAMTAGSYPEVDHAASDERAGSLFKACVERFAPHLIHFHCVQRMTATVTEVARNAGIPYVITLHDGWWISDRQFLYDATGPAPRYDFAQPLRHRPKAGHTAYNRPMDLLPSLKGAVALLAVSEPFAEVYRATGLTNVRTVANGLPRVSTGRAASPSQTTVLPVGNRVRIAHIGGTEPHKGLFLLKYAVHIAKPASIAILVVDHAIANGERHIENWNGTPVDRIAKRPQGEVGSLYDEIDILFAPSLWPESFGLVTREAISAGCWVVASDRGAVGEPVVEGVNGHVVSVDTVDGLVGVLKQIDTDPSRYRSGLRHRRPCEPRRIRRGSWLSFIETWFVERWWRALALERALRP